MSKKIKDTNDYGVEIPESYKDKKNKLDPKYLGQFRNPEVQKKIQATKKRNRARLVKERKQIEAALEVGYDESMLADPDVQAALLDELALMAFNGEPADKKWAFGHLIANGAFKMIQKQEVTTKTDGMAPKEAMEFLEGKGLLKKDDDKD